MSPDPAARSIAPLPRSVTWGLLAAWAVHDAEELWTMAGWAERARPRLQRTLPGVPARSWDRLSVSRPHAAVAIGLVGAFVGAAAARGARSGGASPLFQATLAGFGWHAVPHVASAVLTRGYTPGVLTAPTVVAPFALWAWSRLRRAGVPIAPVPRSAALLGAVVVVGAHVAASGLLRCAGRGRAGARGRESACAAAAPRRHERDLAVRCRSGPGAFVVLVRDRHRAGRRPWRTP